MILVRISECVFSCGVLKADEAGRIHLQEKRGFIRFREIGSLYTGKTDS